MFGTETHTHDRLPRIADILDSVWRVQALEESDPYVVSGDRLDFDANSNKRVVDPNDGLAIECVDAGEELELRVAIGEIDPNHFNILAA